MPLQLGYLLWNSEDKRLLIITSDSRPPSAHYKYFDFLYSWTLALEVLVHKKDFKARRSMRDATMITHTKAILWDTIEIAPPHTQTNFSNVPVM